MSGRYDSCRQSLQPQFGPGTDSTDIYRRIANDEVATEATGRLEGLNVQEGRRVKKGDQLARIVAPDVQAQFDAAKAEARVRGCEVSQGGGVIASATRAERDEASAAGTSAQRTSLELFTRRSSRPPAARYPSPRR